ncbi:MAG TPA: Flp family type IVb pilin [Acidimicrobiales bacterium]|nr:Flp family type IVb pilin [Acidimicrobiales bacterium]
MSLKSYLELVVSPMLRAHLGIRDDRGASLVEYALLVALIAVVCILAITFIGNNANSKFSEVSSNLNK